MRLEDLAKIAFDAFSEAGRRLPRPMDAHEQAMWSAAVRAALEALREPSDAMVEAGLESGPMYDDSIAYALPGIWQAMIDAALS